uniref:Uncharacterized protein n=1 Tax=Anguilla anguilla TaxID=7936 RepID=A0A0E9PY52_ANGAN
MSVIHVSEENVHEHHQRFPENMKRLLIVPCADQTSKHSVTSSSVTPGWVTTTKHSVTSSSEHQG